MPPAELYEIAERLALAIVLPLAARSTHRAIEAVRRWHLRKSARAAVT